ncbi:phosphodiester glycosidase family protein [Paenibacillus thiaminolyticus]|uniref:phosphodiester glycosidase family protein n=1 Tax=Paenibacillus thiaminolyticus TaxID=49283 RepID=UPI002542771F|nr:phosphodiester glycosidase family protein [Paenibacillus thiaminolyticus]WII38596.1 phosphodiester glycosidase family protein [Paenibacillus thiaminolyticus]
MKKRAIMAVLGAAFLAAVLGQHSETQAAGRSVGYMDTAANRTYVPIRYLSEQLKYQVKWDKAAQRIDVRANEDTLSLTVGSKKAQVNGAVKQMDAAPFVEGGTTYVPIRFVGEAMKLQMKWDKAASALLFDTAKGKQKLPVVSMERLNRAAAPMEQKQKTFTVGKKRMSASIVEIDLLHPKIRLDVAVAGGKIGSVDSLKHMADASKAAVAMNGTFFDAYTKTSYKAPYGHIVKKGELVHPSPADRRTVLLFTKDNEVEFVQGKEFPQRFEEGDVEGALQAGPRLVTNGKVSVDPVPEGFKDPKILTNSGARSAVGVTSDHKLILLTTSGATIPELAQMMKQAGAHQAMNLDGGASSGLYYKGKYITSPGREISNALLIHYGN